LRGPACALVAPHSRQTRSRLNDGVISSCGLVGALEKPP
jgi:hypothetical protein